MIKTETVTINNKTFHHTYSDSYLIRKIGTDEIYTDALDVTAQQYEETELILEYTEATLEQELDVIYGGMA